MSDLLMFVRDDLGPEVRTNGRWHFWRCPFHEERDASFGVTDDGQGWHCFGCNRGGDLIAYRVERGYLTPQEAGQLRHNDGSTTNKAGRAGGSGVTPKAPVRSQLDVPQPAWREQARLFCDYCQERLFETNNEGLDHLRARGLKDDTIGRWGLGWHERSRRREAGNWGLEGKPIHLYRGVVIPWTVESEVWHVKFRQLNVTKPNRYRQIRNGVPTLYGLDHLADRQTVVICEGELDAALLWQEAGDLVDVVAIGTKGAKIDSNGLAHLLAASRWLLALDIDADAEAEIWSQYSGRVERIRPLHGNDLTDFYRAGGDLRAWMLYHLDRMAFELGSTVLGPMPFSCHSTREERSTLLERQAEQSLSNCDQSPEWARQYSDLAEAAGWPCYGMTWPEWAEEVASSFGD